MWARKRDLWRSVNSVYDPQNENQVNEGKQMFHQEPSPSFLRVEKTQNILGDSRVQICTAMKFIILLN